MHETNRRVLVRVIFLIAGLLPTIAIIVAATNIRLPYYANRYAHRLGTATNTLVSIQEIWHPVPHETRIRKIEFRDFESGRLLLTAQQLIVVQSENRIHIRGDAQLHAKADRLWALIRRQLATLHHSGVTGPMTLQFDDLEWSNDAASQSFYGVSIELGKATSDLALKQNEHAAEPPSVSITYRTERESPQAGLVQIHRLRPTGQAEYSLSADTQRNSVNPALLFPRLSRLNGDATVDAKLNLTCIDNSWSGTVDKLRWHDLQLIKLTGRELAPLRMVGSLEFREGSLSLSNDRIESLSGTLAGGPGQISNAFLRRFENLGMAVERETRKAIHQYTNLSLRFRVDTTGCRISGNIENEKPIATPSMLLMGDSIAVSSNQQYRIDQILAAFVTPQNSRSIRFAESLRHRLPLDRLPLR